MNWNLTESDFLFSTNPNDDQEMINDSGDAIRCDDEDDTPKQQLRNDSSVAHELEYFSNDRPTLSQQGDLASPLRSANPKYF